MTWAARGARAGALSALAVGWGLLAHLGAGGHGATVVIPPGALLWAGSATLLLAWFLVAHRAGSGPARRAARLLVAVGTGQASTHAALALAPLLSHQTRLPAAVPGAGAAGGHAGHLPAVVVGAPAPTEVLAALAHGGAPMLLLHGLASITVVVLWTAAGALWHEAASWWGRLVATGTVRVPVRLRWPATGGASLAAVAAPHLSWDGRAPPTPSAAP